MELSSWKLKARQNLNLRDKQSVAIEMGRVKGHQHLPDTVVQEERESNNPPREQVCFALLAHLSVLLASVT